MRRASPVVVLLVLAIAPSQGACRDPYVMASRTLAGPLEEAAPLYERKTSWFDAERTRPRAEWGQLTLPGGRVLKHGVERRYYADGSLRIEREYDEGEPTGHWRQWYEGGQLRQDATYATGEPTETSWWHANGQLSSRGLEEDGVRIGPWKSWHANGQLASEGEYAGGLREGFWRFLAPSGELIEEGRYRGGERDGPWTQGPAYRVEVRAPR